MAVNGDTITGPKPMEGDSESSVSTSSRQHLEQYLVLSKMARGAAIIELIKQVLENPSIHTFGELLESENIKKLADDPDRQSYYRLLKIFAFGTYADYQRESATLPELSPQMINKLRHLTIMSLASKTKRIPYEILQKELDMKNVRELEDLIIDVIYSGVLQAKLDQQKQWLEIEATVGRDVKPEDLPEIIGILSNWCKNCDTVLGSITQQISRANEIKVNNVKTKQQIEAEIAALKKTLKAASDMEDMTTDAHVSGTGMGSAYQQPRESQFEKIKRSAAKHTKGLRGSSTAAKFWKN